MINKKYLRFILQIFLAIVIVYALVTTVQLFSCSCDNKRNYEGVVEIDSIPARLRLGKTDTEGKVQFFASFDPKDLAKLWSNRPLDEDAMDGNIQVTGAIPDIKIIRHNPNLCKNNKHFRWIFYVITSAANSNKRDLIRDTWGDLQLFGNNMTKIIFLIGTPDDDTNKKQLEKEFTIHGDIVQGDFMDADKSNTKKSILALKWISEHCQEAKFALKANDNAFINVFGMMSMMENAFNNDRTVVCPLWSDNTMPILRDPQKCGAYCVKEEDFPGRSFFPQYCAGVGYSLSVSVVKDLYEASLKTELFWIEDVYTTGVLVPKLKEPVDFINCHSSFNTNLDLLKEQYINGKDIEIFISQMDEDDLYRKMWKSLINRLPPTWFSKLSDETIAKYA